MVIASQILLAATVLAAGVAALRQRDRQQADLFLAVLTTAFVNVFIKLALTQGQETLRLVFLVFLLAQPYFLLRLVQHFRPVPKALRFIVIGCTTTGALVLVAAPLPRPISLIIVTAVYFVICQGYAAWALTAQARVTVGVTGWRLRLAAIGTWIVPVLAVLEGVKAFSRSVQHSAPGIENLLGFALALCFYLGLATPRSLRQFWQRGQVYRFLEDVAESNPAEREARAADNLSRAAQRGVSATATLVLLGQEHMVVRSSSNPAWVGRTVVSDAGLVGQARFSLEPMAGTLDECEPRLEALVASAGRHVFAVPIATRDDLWGVLLVIQRYGSLFPDDDMALLWRLCRYTADTLNHARLLTEERERQQRAADARVEESESRLRMMIESITDYAMFTLDAAGLVTSWNVGAEQVFGYDTAAIKGTPAANLFDERGSAFAADLLEARSGISVSREGVCRRNDDSTFLGSSVIRTLRHAGQNAEGFVVVTRNVTEQRQLETRVRQGQKMEAVGRLAGGIAHDFNNLLTIILGYTTILEADAATSETGRDEVTEIRKAAERAAALTRQLLSFSRQQVFQPHVLRLPEIIRGLMSMLTRVLGEQIDILQVLDEHAHPVLADPGEVEQIVINLAVNARDAMGAGGRLTIRVSNAEVKGTSAPGTFDVAPGTYTLLEVADTGAGMDAATKTRIFEPFFTTKEFGRGTGLGLSTVYGIVKQMGGAVIVDSEIGQGASFKVYLPSATAEVDVAPVVATTNEPLGGAETVLLVEDEAAVRALVASLLNRHGYHVITAENPAAATALVASHHGPLDLIVTDVVMPGGTGPELVTALAVMRPGLRTLYISGYAEAALAHQGSLDTGHHFLQKPFTGSQLLEKVRQILSH